MSVKTVKHAVSVLGSCLAINFRIVSQHRPSKGVVQNVVPLVIGGLQLAVLLLAAT